MGIANKDGNWLDKPTAAKRNADPVSLYASQLVATVCIQVPDCEISCPEKYKRYLGVDSTRKAPDFDVSFSVRTVVVTIFSSSEGESGILYPSLYLETNEIIIVPA